MSLAIRSHEPGGLRKLVIDEHAFWNEIRREVDYHDEAPQPLYLDLHTGQFLRALCNPDSDQGVPSSAKYSSHSPWRPIRYSRIPHVTHSDYGQLLKSFLASDWTPEDARKTRARLAYSPSVGRWMKQVNDPDVVDAFFRFRDIQIKKRITDFLHCAGVDPEWKTC